MKVRCTIEEIELEGMPSVEATCSRCQHTTESYGTGDASRRRCLVMLHEECPKGESNFYVDEDDEQ
jgi:hypothetical protein